MRGGGGSREGLTRHGCCSGGTRGPPRRRCRRRFASAAAGGEGAEGARGRGPKPGAAPGGACRGANFGRNPMQNGPRGCAGAQVGATGRGGAGQEALQYGLLCKGWGPQGSASSSGSAGGCEDELRMAGSARVAAKTAPQRGLQIGAMGASSVALRTELRPFSRLVLHNVRLNLQEEAPGHPIWGERGGGGGWASGPHCPAALRFPSPPSRPCILIALKHFLATKWGVQMPCGRPPSGMLWITPRRAFLAADGRVASWGSASRDELVPKPNARTALALWAQRGGGPLSRPARPPLERRLRL